MDIEKGSIWILGGGAVLLIALSIAGPLFFERWFPKKEQEERAAPLTPLTPPHENNGPRPWIEIVSADVFLLSNEDEKTRLPAGKHGSLTSGDELTTGMIIATDATGRAIIHFQNGSLARIDRDTELILEAGVYDESDKTLMVAMKLASGRVWSRIVELATPASLWEIKTANAVAVVRGTAFGVEYSNGVSRVIGSENNVIVIPIDSKTNKRVEKAAVIITPEKFVEITKEGISPIRDVSPEIRGADWIKEARTQQKEEKRSETPKATEIKSIVIPARINRAVAKELIIDIDLQTKIIREGEKKTLRALALMNDGTKRDVSDHVTWKILGAIGSVAPDGIFIPKLIGAQAEFGNAVGSIVATFTTEDGRELIGTTPTFEVQAVIEKELDLRG